MATTIALTSQIDHLLYSTTRIEAHLPGGALSIGTGFFMRFLPDPSDGTKFFPAIVTAAHVVQGATAGRILLHEAHVGSHGTRRPSGRRMYAEVEDFGTAWINHPDERVDLCAAPLGPMMRRHESGGRGLFPVQLGENLIPAEGQLADMQVLENVVMVGYPRGLADEAHGFPIFRHGFTASHPALNFNDRPWGALDIAAFHGSSGSPVLMYRSDLDYSVHVRPPVHPVLLGVLFGVPKRSRGQELKIEYAPTILGHDDSPYPFMHLGYYIKARELLELKKQMLRVLGMTSE